MLQKYSILRNVNLIKFFTNYYPKNKKIFKKNKDTINIETSVTNNTTDTIQDNFIIYYDHPKLDTIRPTDINFKISRPDDELIFTIEGEENQMAVVDIYPNKKIKSETAKLIYFTEGIELNTTTGNSYFDAFKRMLSGSSFFVTEYTYKYDKGFGRIGFAEPYPSKMIPVRLSDYNGEIICQKGAFVCGTTDINIEITYTKNLKTAFFGGEGFILQKISGNGTCLVKAGGTIIKRKLREKERIKISPGIIVFYESSISFDVEYVGGLKNILGAGTIFYAVLTGPGDVFLQTMSFDQLVESISSRLPRNSSSGSYNRSSNENNNKTDENSSSNPSEESNSNTNEEGSSEK